MMAAAPTRKIIADYITCWIFSSPVRDVLLWPEVDQGRRGGGGGGEAGGANKAGEEGV